MSSYVTVPRIVAFVALAVVGAVLFIAEKNGGTQKIVMRYLKSSSKKIKWEDRPLSSDINAPIFMQDHTGTHEFVSLLKKYGLHGSDGDEPADDEDEAPLTSDYNWVRAAITPTTNCGGRRKYMLVGVKTGECTDTGSGGIKITCAPSGKVINYYSYTSGKCKGTPTTSVKVKTTGCAGDVTGNTPWGKFDDDAVKAGTYHKSIKYECLKLATHEDPTEIDDEHLDVYKVYSSKNCGGKYLTYFEAYYGDTCIPIKTLTGYDESSIEFKYDSGTTDYPYTDPYLYAKIYGSSKNCEGAMDTLTFSDECESGAKWEYWNAIHSDDDKPWEPGYNSNDDTK